MPPEIESEEDVVQFVDAFYDTGLVARRPYEKQWYLNMAFFLGHHWLTWNSYAQKLEKPRAPSWRVRHTANYIMPTCLRILGKLSRNKPVMTTIPASQEDEDIGNAEVSGKLLKYLAKILKDPIANLDLLLINIIFGTAFRNTPWVLKGKKITQPQMGMGQSPVLDPATGNPVIDESTGEPMLEERMQPIMDEFGNPKVDEIWLGEVGQDILTPFDVIPPPAAKEPLPPEGLPCVMIAKVRSLEYIRDNYPEKGGDVQDEGISSQSAIEAKLQNMLGDATQHSNEEQKRERGQKKLLSSGNAILKEYQELPTKSHPNGRYFVVANHKLLKFGDLPYQDDKKDVPAHLSITKYDYIKIVGRFWGKGVPEDLIPLNKEYNKTISQIIENKNLMSRPKWKVPKGCKVKKTALTSQPGEVVEYVPVGGLGPDQINVKPLPSYVGRILDRTINDLYENSNMKEVSRGATPAGVTSGVAIGYLQEQDDTALGPIVYRFEECEKEVAIKRLWRVKQFYKEPRQIKIVGRNNEVDVFDFMASENMNTDVTVQAGSALPSSKTAKQQFVLSLWKEQVLTDPRNVLEMLQFGNIEKVYEDMEADANNQRMENKRMAQGDRQQVYDFDNHRIHLYELDKFRKGKDYRQMHPQLQQLFILHAEEHAAFILETQQAQQPQAPQSPQPGASAGGGI